MTTRVTKRMFVFPLVVVAASLFLLSHADFFTFNVNTNTTKQVNKEAAVKDTISIVREGGFNVSVVVPSQSCPRYGIVDTEYSGGGHRFAAFVVAFLLASETGSTLIVPPIFWRTPSHHGSYEWMPRFLGWTEKDFRPTYFPTTTVGSSTLDDVRRNMQKCKVSTRFSTGYPRFCGGFYCTTNSAWAFKRARPMLLGMRNRVTHLDRKLPKPQGVITCAWHIRLGDDVIAKEIGLVTMLGNIYKVASKLGKKVAHHVFSNGRMCVKPTNYYCEMYRDLVANGTTFWTEAKEQETLELMISADITVSSGSSFPIMASALAPDSQIPIMMPPKEAIRSQGPAVWETYDRGDSLRASGFGQFVNPGEFERRMSQLP